MRDCVHTRVHIFFSAYTAMYFTNQYQQEQAVVAMTPRRATHRWAEPGLQATNDVSRLGERGVASHLTRWEYSFKTKMKDERERD